MRRSRAGFTLIEMLVALAIMSLVLAVFSQVFVSTMSASSIVNARNELTGEAQIAQQILASRLQSAYYIYPVATAIKLGGSFTTANTVGSATSQNWTVGTDPFIAMLLPPKTNGICSSSNPNACFAFYAYYPIKRDYLTTNVSGEAPPKDANNANAWVLMQYTANIVDNVDRSSNRLASPPLPGTTYGKAYESSSSTPRSGTMLVDYVKPLDKVAPYTTLFDIQAASNLIDLKLRMERTLRNRQIGAPASKDPLSTRIFPRNWD